MTAKAMSVAREQKERIRSALVASKDNFIQLIGGDQREAERLVVSALTIVNATPALMSCDPKSIVISVARAAMSGADLASGKGEGFLIPYARECTFVEGYRLYQRALAEAGYDVVAEAIHGDSVEWVANKSGDLLSVVGGDSFMARSIPPALRYTMNPLAKDKPRLFAFASAHAGKRLVAVVMVSEAEITKALGDKKKGGGKTSPAWDAWADRMWRRLPIKRLAATLDLRKSEKAQRLVEYMNLDDAGGVPPGFEAEAEDIALQPGKHSAFGFTPKAEAEPASEPYDMPDWDDPAPVEEAAK